MKDSRQGPWRVEFLKIGIIGHKGFVGSAFYDEFSKGGDCEVIGIEKGNLETARAHEYDLLVNCNGNSSKRLADKDPALDFQMNVATTLDFLLNFKYGGYVHISTCEVYADRSSPQTTGEDTPIDPLALSNYGFSKYMAEQAVKKYAGKWLILRLSGMVGKNMSKGPAYDIINLHKLFISEKSRYQYINTADVASMARKLIGKGRWGAVYNIVGKGSMELSEVAGIAGAKLKEAGKDVQVFGISTAKIEKELGFCPDSEKTIADFCRKK